MSKKNSYDQKKNHLKLKGTLNPKPQRVKDELFKKYDFFDPYDLIQTKYEMLRRVEKDGWTISKASEMFGFSRPSFYEARGAFQKEGLGGLIPQKRGPKKAHKLSEEIVSYLENLLTNDSNLRATRLTLLVEEKFGLRVHPRSIERALRRKKKKEKK